HHDPAGRAERPAGTVPRAPGVRAGDRPHRQERYGRRAAARLRGEGGVPRRGLVLATGYRRYSLGKERHPPMFGMTRNRRVPLALLGAAALTLGLAACGEKEPADTPGGDSSAPAVAVDEALAAKVPDAIKADGKITVGNDPTYAPAEILDR